MCFFCPCPLIVDTRMAYTQQQWLTLTKMITENNNNNNGVLTTDEGDSQAVGLAIGLLVDSEADIPAVEAYAQALKSGGGAAAAPAAAAAAPEAASAPAPAAAAAAAGGES